MKQMDTQVICILALEGVYLEIEVYIHLGDRSIDMVLLIAFGTYFVFSNPTILLVSFCYLGLKRLNCILSMVVVVKKQGIYGMI